MKFSKIIFFLFLSTSSIAQTTLSKKQVELLPNTIENQFLKIFKKGNSWHEYKMIKKAEFISFQKNILDSISLIKKDVLAKQKTITEQDKNILALKNEITSLNNSLNISTTKEDSISFFGKQIKKGFYNTILWGIIFALLLALIFFIYKFNNGNNLTKQAQLNLEEIEKESELYRKKAIEKEQKLRRQLQDEINKQRGV